jgi:hypothetical protein
MATYTTQPAVTPAAAPAAAPQISRGDRLQILCEAITVYLRTNLVIGDALTVCEDFITGCNQEARAAATTQQQGQG